MVTAVLVLLALMVRGISWADIALQRRVEASSRDHNDSDESTSTLELQAAESDVDHQPARVAAIAVALALAESEHAAASAPKSLAKLSAGYQPSEGAWVNQGRARQRDSRASHRIAGNWQ